MYVLWDIFMTTWQNILRTVAPTLCLLFAFFLQLCRLSSSSLFFGCIYCSQSTESRQLNVYNVNVTSNHILFYSVSLCSSSCYLSSPSMSASALPSPFQPTLPPPPPSLPHSDRTTETKSMAVTGDALDESPWLQRLSHCSAEKWKNPRKKGFSWRGMEGGEEGAEVEMWTEVRECRPGGYEPLIDCRGLTQALCDWHFQHTHSLYFYSCEGLLLLSFPPTLTATLTCPGLTLNHTLFKCIILEVHTSISACRISADWIQL